MVPLISVEDVAALLPIRAGNTSQDAKLNLLIGSASSLIEQTISRELDRKERVEFFNTPLSYRAFYDFIDAENSSGSYVDPRPVRYTLKAFNVDVNETFEVRYDPAHVFGDDTIVPATYYTLDAANGLLMLRYAMVEASQSLRVTYTGGYLVSGGTLRDSLPAELKMACIAQVLHMFGKFTAENIGKTSDTTENKAGGDRYAARMGLVPEALALISKYKPMGLGIY